jgi:hypothetical protein
VETMNDVLIYAGSGIAILMGSFHFVSTKLTLRNFQGLDSDNYHVLLAMWNAVGFMLFYLGAVPLALVLLGTYEGSCATVIGISAVAFSGVLAVSGFATCWPTRLMIGKAMGFVFAAIAVLFGLGTFL